MATVIRIKRRLDEEPTENIVIKCKRSRKESSHEKSGDVAAADNNSAVLTRLGTVESKEDPLEPLILRAVKKGWELRESYKRLRTGVSYKQKTQQEAKGRAVSKRYKIFSQSRGIDDHHHVNSKESLETSKEKDKSTLKRINAEGAEAMPSSTMDFSYFDAELAHEAEDIITCNGIPMMSEKYVYDVFYSDQPVKWEEVMEQNICRIETEVLESLTGSSSDGDDSYEDDDDENEEGNWRNDYPDYDDSPCEDEEDYLNSQLRKYNTRKRYETDESYDEEDYEDEGFDIDGNLIMAAPHPFSLTRMMRNTHLDDDTDSDD